MAQKLSREFKKLLEQQENEHTQQQLMVGIYYANHVTSSALFHAINRRMPAQENLAAVAGDGTIETFTSNADALMHESMLMEELGTSDTAIALRRITKVTMAYARPNPVLLCFLWNLVLVNSR